MLLENPNRRTFLFVTISELSSRGLVFLFLPIAALITSVDNVAIISLMLPLIQSLQNASSLGSPAYLLKYFNYDNRHLGGASFLISILVFLASVIIVMLLDASGSLQSEVIKKWTLIPALLVTLALGLMNQRYAIYQITGKLHLALLFYVIIRLIIFGGALCFLYMGIDEMLIYWSVVSLILTVMFMLSYNYSKDSIYSMLSMMIFGAPIFLNSIITYGNLNLSRVLLINKMNDEMLAEVALSLAIPQACVLFFSIYSRFTAPIVMSREKSNFIKRNTIKKNHKMLLLAILSLGITFLLILYTDAQLYGVFEMYNVLIVAMGFLSFGLLSFNAAYTDVIYYNEKTIFISLNLFVSGVFGVITSIALFEFFGVYAISFGILISSIFQGVITYQIAHRMLCNV